MRRFAWLVIAIVALMLLMIMIAITVKPITRYQTHRAASMYYRHLATGEFEKAFEYVAYYDRCSDLEPEVPYEDAQRIWVSRVNEMRENGLYLAEAERIQVLIDDGYPIGKAYVTIVDNGMKQSMTQDVRFVRLFGKWRVQGVRSAYDELTKSIAILDEAISGHIPQD